jgi:putative ABC transport system permease protein
VANLARRRADSVVQIVALGLGLSVLLLLAIIRGDLIDEWRSRLPQTAPNYFFVNIPPDQRAPFESFLTSAGGRLSRMLPMIRGRMLEINGVSVLQRAGPIRARKGRSAAEPTSGGGNGGSSHRCGK